VWTAPCRAYDKALDDWLSLRARTHPEHPAVVAEGRSITYARLADCRAGVRAPLIQEARGTHRFVAHLWSAWQSGMPFIPLDPRLHAPPAPIDPPPGTRTVIFTSGTTGEPKPVYLTAANHEASAIASAWSLGVDPGDRWLCCLPLWHVGGLNILIRSTIYGTTAVVHDGFDAERVRDEIQSGGVTVVSLVATMLRRLIEAGMSEWPGLRAALVGGGPVPSDLVEWAQRSGFPLLQTYGMTETCSQVATGGRPLLGVDLRTTEEGEILVRGPMVAPGAAAGDGWLHTGDRGRLDAHGSLHVEGRLDDMIVTGGENVAAAEVEEALLSHPAVTDAAVVGRPDAEWGQAVTAHVVLAVEATDAELIAHCRERLAPFKLPKSIHRRDELPRNAAGKLLRRALVESAP
jgi:O-succinylbenzoic acid--CoA ligase